MKRDDKGESKWGEALCFLWQIDWESLVWEIALFFPKNNWLAATVLLLLLFIDWSADKNTHHEFSELNLKFPKINDIIIILLSYKQIKTENQDNLEMFCTFIWFFIYLFILN